MEENSVPVADKIAINKVGEFETQTVTGDTFTNQDIPAVAFMVFLDPEDAGAQAYYDELVKAGRRCGYRGVQQGRYGR